MTKSDDKRVPALRFKGFTNEWEQRKLGQDIIISKVKNKDNLSLPAFSISNKNGFVPQEEQFGKDNTYSKTDKSSNYIVSPKYFAYNPARINVGSIAYQNTKTPVLVSSLYEIFRSNNNIDDVFLQYWFKSEYFYKQIQRLQEGGVRQYFFIDKMKESRIYLTKVIEQNKIGALISKIDKLITLQQRKLKDYSLIKKKLSNIFFNDTIVNQNNFLFKHRVKASQLFISYSKKGFAHLPVLSASQDKGMIFREAESKNILYAHNNLTNYKLVEPDDFVVHLRSFQGGFAYSDKTGIASPAYTIFKFKDDVDYNLVYWKEKFKSYNFIQLLKKVTYGVRDGRSISFSDFLSLYLTFPDIEIQNKIGSALSKLDTQISDQKKIIKKLENVKQFLLQNMFI